MRIAIISIYPDRGQVHANTGGVASYTKNLVRNLPKNGDEYFVFCNKRQNLAESYEEDGMQIVRCFDKNIACFFQLLKEVRAVKPDVVHIQQELSLYGGIANAYLLQWFLACLRMLKIKVILTLHGVVSLKKLDKSFVEKNGSRLPVLFVKLAFIVIYKPLSFWAKQTIVHEENFKNILEKEYGSNVGKIQVVHHGIEDLVPLPKEDARAHLGIAASKNVCLFMGYLAGYKGLDLLIDGFEKYVQKDKDAYLVIGAGLHPKLGSDPSYLAEYGRLERKAKERLPQNQYSWVGFIQEEKIQSYMSAADVILFPYTAAISSSGPMAISIGYSTPFLASEVFSSIFDAQVLFPSLAEDMAEKLKSFFDRPEAVKEYIQELRQERLWSKIGSRTRSLYGL